MVTGAALASLWVGWRRKFFEGVVATREERRNVVSGDDEEGRCAMEMTSGEVEV